MKLRLAVLFLLLPLGARADEPPVAPEALLPEGTLAFWKADSLPELGKSLAASPVYAGAGTWAGIGRNLILGAGIPAEPRHPILWGWIEALAPHAKGPAAAALLGTGPVALARDLEWKALEAWAEGQAKARGLALSREPVAGAPSVGCEALRVHAAFVAPWCLAARDRETLAGLVAAAAKPPEASLAASPLYRSARAAAPGSCFLFAGPGLLKGRAADAVGWGCGFGPDGSVEDRIRLLRPGRKAWIPAGPSGRLASALPAEAAFRFRGRLSGARLRQAVTGILGEHPASEPLLAALSGWEGEAVLSAGWTLIFPDLLLGFEAENPLALVRTLLAEAEARGAKVAEAPGDPEARAVFIPGQSLSWVIRAGERSVWIGTMPARVQAAATGKEDAAAVLPGLRMALGFPEVFGPAAKLAGLLPPEAAPLARLARARARWEFSVEEDAGGLTLASRSPWGLQPLLAAGALGFQALDALPVVETPEAVTARVRAALPGLRGLAFRQPLQVHVVTQAETRALFEKAFEKELPPGKLAAMQEEMQAFGLLKPGRDLRGILTGAFVDMVGGFYDPETKGLYLIRGMPAQAVVAAHEMTHALQDQHFDLQGKDEAAKKLPADSDRDAAFLAVVEGDATLAMQRYLEQELQGAPLRALRVLLEVLASPRLALEQLLAMRDMPGALLRQTLFSYEEGMDFVKTVQAGKGWAGVDALFADPPASTEQVLHPAKYLGAGRDLPKPVSLKDLGPALEGWKPVGEDTLGELGVQVLLKEFILGQVADRAAAGWGGDRYALFAREGERLLVWRTVWDSEKDAKEFAEALGKAQDRRWGAGEGAWKHGDSLVRVVVRGSRVVLLDGPRDLVQGEGLQGKE